MKFQKEKPRWDLEELYAQWQKVQDTWEEKYSVMECESESVEVQWNSIKKCVLDTMSSLIRKVDRKNK